MSDLISLQQRRAEAEQTVRRFVRRFEPSYHALACHAALPLVLTPELVNYLRNEFLRNEEVPWVAEVDLLLSDLCRPVGYELYAMDTDVRAYLLAELERQFGRARIHQVAKLLISYVRYLAETGTSANKKELEAQQWAAMVYLDANQRQTAVRQIAERFQASGVGTNSVGESLVNTAELSRLAQITTELAPELTNYPRLLDYAALVSEVIIGDGAVEAAQLEQSYEVLQGYELKLPDMVGERVIDQATRILLRGDNSQVDYDKTPDATSLGKERGISEHFSGGNQGRATKNRKAKSTLVSWPPLINLRFETGYFVESTETQQFNRDVQLLLKPNNPHARSLLAFIKRTIRQFGLQDHLTEIDVFVEAYLRGVRYTQQNQEPIDQPRAWMLRTAYNIIREVKRDRQHYSLAFDETVEQIPELEDSLPLSEDEDTINRSIVSVLTALESLSPGDSNLIQWKVVEGLTWQEVQARMLAEGGDQISQTALRKRGQRALENLREAYKKIDGESNPIEAYTPKENILKTASLVTSNYRDAVTQYMELFRRQQESTKLFVEPFTNDVDVQMILLPAGTFLMGSSSNELKRQDREGPQYEVSVPAFFMARFPITQVHWHFVAELPPVNRNLTPNPSRIVGDTYPIEQVSWFEAVEFCDRLSLYTGRPYRLPTEAEWEYACRANTTTPFHFGETITTDLANYNGADEQHGAYGRGPKGENRQTTTSVDHFGIANAFGLCDMHGNVWEWCQDSWRPTYGEPSKGKIKAAPQPDQSTHRVARGGSWYTPPHRCRSASRIHFDPESRHADVGFRIVCSL